jgi:hypothetical protein
MDDNGYTFESTNSTVLANSDVIGQASVAMKIDDFSNVSD